MNDTKYMCVTCKEYKALFDLQHTRMGEATKVWQKETGKHDTFPDLGDLLDWLLASRAASPDLLEACKFVLETEKDWPYYETRDNFDEPRKHLQAAIAKAEGNV